MQMATTYSVCLITYSFVVRFSIRVSISIHRSLISRTAPSSFSTRFRGRSISTPTGFGY